MVDAILKFMGLIGGAVGALSKESAERRILVADYLDRVSALLAAVQADIDVGVFPAGSCAEMGVHAENLAVACSNWMDERQLGELVTAMKDAQRVEGLWSEAQGQPEGVVTNQIAMASGKFRGYAALVRAGL
jgi:hypothetical protein